MQLSYTSQITPVEDWVLVEAIEQEKAGELYVVQASGADREGMGLPDLFRILSIGPKVEGYEPGQVVILNPLLRISRSMCQLQVGTKAKFGLIKAEVVAAVVHESERLPEMASIANELCAK